MSLRTVASVVVVALLAVPTVSEAGLAGLLGKLGKAGSAAAKAGKVAKVGKVARIGKLGKAATLGKAAVGVTAVVAAERAGLVFGHLGDDAARTAGFLARSAEGEAVLVTKAGSAIHSEASVQSAVSALGREGAPPHIFVDAQAVPKGEVLSNLPPDTAVTVVDDGVMVAARRVEEQGVGHYVVDTAEGAMDVADIVGGLQDASESDEADSSSPPIWFYGLCFMALIGWLVFKAKKAAQPTSPG